MIHNPQAESGSKAHVVSSTDKNGDGGYVVISRTGGQKHTQNIDSYVIVTPRISTFNTHSNHYKMTHKNKNSSRDRFVERAAGLTAVGLACTTNLDCEGTMNRMCLRTSSGCKCGDGSGHGVRECSEGLYAVLGVSYNAELEDIRRAWKTQIRTIHPDSGGDVEAYTKLMYAYRVLSDADSRLEYDEELRHSPGPEPSPIIMSDETYFRVGMEVEACYNFADAKTEFGITKENHEDVCKGLIAIKPGASEAIDLGGEKIKFNFLQGTLDESIKCGPNMCSGAEMIFSGDFAIHIDSSSDKMFKVEEDGTFTDITAGVVEDLKMLKNLGLTGCLHASCGLHMHISDKEVVSEDAAHASNKDERHLLKSLYAAHMVHQWTATSQAAFQERGFHRRGAKYARDFRFGSDGYDYRFGDRDWPGFLGELEGLDGIPGVNLVSGGSNSHVIMPNLEAMKTEIIETGTLTYYHGNLDDGENGVMTNPDPRWVRDESGVPIGLLPGEQGGEFLNPALMKYIAIMAHDTVKTHRSGDDRTFRGPHFELRGHNGLVDTPERNELNAQNLYNYLRGDFLTEVYKLMRRVKKLTLEDWNDVKQARARREAKGP